MEPQLFELFLHGCGDPQVIEAEGAELLKDVLARHNALPGDGEFVFVGEAEEARTDVEGECDTHTPADVSLTVLALLLPEKRHIHTKAARSVTVTVNYNGQKPKRHFSPAATIETVTVWAKKRFHIDDADGAELVLELEPSKEIPRIDQHLGELLRPGLHALEFNLVKEVNPQG
jgi:hypothetical protein